MAKKSELWLAFSDDELTCSIAAYDTAQGSYIEVKLSGVISTKHVFIWDFIAVAINNSTFSEIFLDTKGFSFFTGHTVNDNAIDLLLKFVSAMSHTVKKLHLMLEDGCVKQVLVQALPTNKFQSVEIVDPHITPKPSRAFQFWGGRGAA